MPDRDPPKRMRSGTSSAGFDTEVGREPAIQLNWGCQPFAKRLAAGSSAASDVGSCSAPTLTVGCPCFEAVRWVSRAPAPFQELLLGCAACGRPSKGWSQLMQAIW